MTPCQRYFVPCIAGRHMEHYKRAVWWSVLFSTKIFSLLAPGGWILIHPLLLSAVVAQLVEQSPCKRQVISSSLIGSFPNPVNMYDDCHVQRQASLEIF